MREVSAIDIHAPRYERKGECGRCGSCCEHVGCEHLSYDGEVAVCGTYSDRPPMCVEFPANPPVVYERCTFRFWDKWEGRLLARREIT